MPIVRVEDGDGNENEIEVPTDAIDLTEDDDPTNLPGVQEELNRVAGKTRKNTRSSVKSSLKDDDEFWQEMAQSRGVELREDDLMPKGASKNEELKELKKRNAELEQKAQKADEYEEQIEQARDTRLENQLLQHAEGVKEDMKDLFLGDAKSRFTYDEDDDDFYPTDEDGNPQYASSTEDVIENLREKRPSMFKDRSANPGPDDEPTSTDSSKKTWTEEEWQAAADRTHQMSEEEFADWDTAKQEGRVQE